MRIHSIRTVVALAALTLLDPAALLAQQSGSTASQSRATAILASFNKSKHVVKERHGVRREKFKEIRSAPAVKANAADYSGHYEVRDLGFGLDLRVDRSGNVEGSGYEPTGPDVTVKRRFTLRNGKIDGVLLTGTQVFANGEQTPFEGVFMNVTSLDSPTDRGSTEFGIGVMGKDIHIFGVTMTRLFYVFTP